MRQKVMNYLMGSPVTILCMMTVSFLGFGYFSVNLFFLFRSNVELINNFGWLALQEGAATQLFLLVGSAFVSVIFYAVWKVGERLLVDWLVGRPLD